MDNKKTYKQLLKETFTKTRDERYAEASTKDKVIYWIVIAIVLFIIAYLLLDGLT